MDVDGTSASGEGENQLSDREGKVAGNARTRVSAAATDPTPQSRAWKGRRARPGGGLAGGVGF